MVVLNSRDHKECMESGFFTPPKTHLTIGFSYLNALVYCCNNAVHLLNKAKSLLLLSIMNFENLENCLDFVSAGQPNVTPSCARCMAPEIQHSKGNPIRFTKLLFR